MVGVQLEDINEITKSISIWGRQVVKTAVVYGDESLSYKALDTLANKIANYLIKNEGIGKGQIVALCVPKSIYLLPLIIGIIRSGACYLPIDAESPTSRMQVILDDARPSLIIASQQTADNFFDFRVTQVSVVLEKAEQEEDSYPCNNVGLESLCYVIYTSGTTGKPNGVKITHGNLIHLLTSAKTILDFSDQDTWSVFHSYAFDFSVWEIWGAIAFGGRCVLISSDVARQPALFVNQLKSERVTILNQTPVSFYYLSPLLFKAFESQSLALKKVIFGGDKLNFGLLKNWFFELKNYSKISFYNMYGITETTIHVTCHKIKKDDVNQQKSIIGKPLPGYEVILLDDKKQIITSANTLGELCIAGPSVSSGYLHNLELTEKRFKTINGKRYYFSGDLGEYLENGLLAYKCRKDNQVKVRGYRIELDEVEHYLLQLDEIKNAVVLADYNQKKMFRLLIAYIQCNDRYRCNAPAIRKKLRRIAPDYMVPDKFLFKEKFPLTVNKKVDKKALANGGC